VHKRLTSCASALIVIAAAMVAGLVTPASADDSTSITASADAYVRSDLVDKNYGSTTTLYTDAADATGPDMRTFLKFDLSSQAPGRTIQSAVLKVATAAASTSGSTGTMQFKLVDDATWTGTGLTWSNAPSTGATLGSLSDTTYGQQYAVDLDRGAVQNALGGNLSLAIDTASTDSFAISSTEGSLPPPTLDITYRTATPPRAYAAIEPSADSYTNAAAAGSNFGTTKRLYSDGDGSAVVLRTYMKFDLSQYSGSTLLAATLKVHTHLAPGGSVDSHAIRSVSDTTWTETGLTWANQPAVGPPVGTLSAPGEDTTYSVALDKTAIEAALGGDLSLAIDDSGNDGLTIASKDSTTMAHPQLVLSFRAQASNDPVVWAVGDLCDTSHQCANTANVITQDTPPSAVMLVGDEAYDNGTDADFQSLDHDFGSKLFADGSSIASKALPTAGNHEYRTPYAAGYFDYFSGTEGLGFVGRYDRRSWYAKDIGNWRLISVNSNYAREPGTGSCNTWCQSGVTSTKPSVGGLTATQAFNQRAFLAAQLDDAQAKGMGAIVFDHHPALTDGDYAPGTKLGRNLFGVAAAHGAELFISGHSHNFQRFAARDASGALSPTGVAQYIVGGGGREPFDAFTATDAAWQDNTHHGAARIVLHGHSAEVGFEATDGSTLDISSIAIH
jgi:acid phosphatase type 7